MAEQFKHDARRLTGSYLDRVNYFQNCLFLKLLGDVYDCAESYD